MAETEKVITNLELVKASIEWDYPLDYQIMIDNAIQTIRELQSSNISFQHTINKLFESLKKADEQIPKWHLVADGDLPKSGTKVLTITDKDDIEVTIIGGCYWVSHLACHFGEDKIIVWMELPKFEESEE